MKKVKEGTELQKLRDKGDKHKLEMFRLQQKTNKKIKIGDQQIVDRFQNHVDRGVFTKNVDEKVSKEMKDFEKSQKAKEIEKKKKMEEL